MRTPLAGITTSLNYKRRTEERRREKKKKREERRKERREKKKGVRRRRKRRKIASRDNHLPLTCQRCDTSEGKR
tara:strand:+ start:574 stop:795 length:222 start_codon:yes stop_codon:yes gene_type:complete